MSLISELEEVNYEFEPSAGSFSWNDEGTLMVNVDGTMLTVDSTTVASFSIGNGMHEVAFNFSTSEGPIVNQTFVVDIIVRDYILSSVMLALSNNGLDIVGHR